MLLRGGALDLAFEDCRLHQVGQGDEGAKVCRHQQDPTCWGSNK